MKLPTLERLRRRRVLRQGWTHNLVLETPTVRVWLSRLTAEDGETCPVSVEVLRNGRWVETDPHNYVGGLPR